MANKSRSQPANEPSLEEVLHQLGVLQRQLDQLTKSTGAPIERGPRVHSSSNEIGLLVRHEINQRNLRSRFFPIELFGEPGWNILLDLFVQESEGKRITVSSACLASNAPETTGLRYVKYLESLKLISREKDPIDRRKTYLSLTPDCRESIRRYFSKVAENGLA